MKGVIWYKTKEKGLLRLEELIDDYKQINIDVQRVQNNTSEIHIQFSNNDVWVTTPETNNSRGIACNVALIDNDIEQDIINTIIMPTLKMKPYRAYNFYSYDFELEEGDKIGIYGKQK